MGANIIFCLFSKVTVILFFNMYRVCFWVIWLLFGVNSISYWLGWGRLQKKSANSSPTIKKHCLSVLWKKMLILFKFCVRKFWQKHWRLCEQFQEAQKYVCTCTSVWHQAKISLIFTKFWGLVTFFLAKEKKCIYYCSLSFILSYLYHKFYMCMS